MRNHIKINNSIKPFNKQIEVSGDKSISIRCVLIASQAIGKSRIYNLLESEDVISALNSIKKLGIKFKKKNNYYEIYGYGINGYKTNKNITINAGNSGTLARLILGLLINSKKKIKIIGDKSLSKRDFSRVTEPLKLFGAKIISNKKMLPVEIVGSDFLRPIKYIEKLGSAQCKSSIMLGAIKTPGTTIIKAKKSRNHTELIYQFLKIPIKFIKKKQYDLIEVRGPSNFSGFNYIVPGDISSAAFFIVLTLLSKNSKIILRNINVNSSRIGIIKILNRINANINLKNKRLYNGENIGDIIVKSRNNLKSINSPKNLNSSAIDEFLIIFLVATKAKGISIFKELGEMNKKESKRLNLAIKFLKKIGVKVERFKDDIRIHGNPDLELYKNYEMKNFLKDHRIFFLSCITALTLGGKWRINDKDSINTSFPNFLKILKEMQK